MLSYSNRIYRVCVVAFSSGPRSWMCFSHHFLSNFSFFNFSISHLGIPKATVILVSVFEIVGWACRRANGLIGLKE